MNILCFFPTYRPLSKGSKGGGEISNIALIEWLASNGHNVTVLAQKTDGQNECNVNGVKIVTLFPKRIHFAFFSMLGIKAILRDFLGVNKFDVVISTTDFIGLANSVCSKENIPNVALVRAFENFGRISSYKRRIKSVIFGGFFEDSLRNADKIIANSNYMRDFIDASVFSGASTKTTVVYPPVSVRVASSSTSFIDRSKVVMVGTSRKKGVDLFIKIAASRPEYDFEIIGSCLNVSVPDNLKVTGWCDSIDKFSNEAALVLVPSEWNEPFGRVAVESILCGTPVLVSDKGGLPEAVGYKKEMIVRGGLESWLESIDDLFENFKIGAYEFDTDFQLLSSGMYSIDSQGAEFERQLKEVVGLYYV